MAKLLFVCHRYAPYPGGTEEYVKWMAEEMLSRGHDVHVLAETHKGDLNGVKVTGNHNVLLDSSWDLIIVHGADCSSQDVVHRNWNKIPSPVLYMIIKPSMSEAAMTGLFKHKYLGVSTFEDSVHVERFRQHERAVSIPHGIVPWDLYTGSKHDLVAEFPDLGIDPNAIWFMSSGGFAPHKGMWELADVYNEAIQDYTHNTQLLLFGYSDGDIIQQTKNVRVIKGLERDNVLKFLAKSEYFVMNSYEEGFGLTLLEALYAKCNVWSRDIAGAKILKSHISLHTSRNILRAKFRGFIHTPWNVNTDKLDRAHYVVKCVYSIHNTCDYIDAVLKKEGKL